MKSYAHGKRVTVNGFALLLGLCLATVQAQAAVSIKAAEGWLETAWVEWMNTDGAAAYNVYVSADGEQAWTKLDHELVRNYGAYGRADALGLKAGDYQLKVVPVDAQGAENADEAATTERLEVRAHNRQGYAHFGRPTSGLFEGVGAYKNDGTLKDDGIVLYVSAQNSKTISVTWPYGTEGKTKTYTGLQTILDGFRKCHYAGGLKKPLCVRIIGTIRYADLDKSLSSQGLAVKGEEARSELPLTIEGVGNDATFYQFGMQVSNCTGVEVRNLGIMLDIDDGIEVASDNSHVWIHNMDMFYGQVGSDADQVKGDGAIDTKLSRYCTIAYNHFFDCGKCCLIDASKTKKENYADSLTYCGNWFDHADQRLPRCRHGEAFHVYNNYYDGNGLYGIGLASNACVFAENNFFRHCKYPVISSRQGTDQNLVNAKQSKKGLLSGENSGICKFYNNHVDGATSFITQHEAEATLFDAYVVDARDEQVPATVAGLLGGAKYSNFDTSDGGLYECAPVAPEDVPAMVTGQYGAGRCGKGDFTWTFNNDTEDANCDVIAELKSALLSYTPTWVGFYSKPTAIGSVRLSNTDQAKLYNLAGQRVATHHHGVTISTSPRPSGHGGCKVLWR